MWPVPRWMGALERWDLGEGQSLGQVVPEEGCGMYIGGWDLGEVGRVLERWDLGAEWSLVEVGPG